ncbi:MAG: hypothetical protein ILP13_02825, partial [Lachnospiraceae bacterium]|nr:hypothetical protein [Lachnospiraceae bacterium]
EFPGEEDDYRILRENPHRYNLMRVSFELNGKEISWGEISEIRQSLDLYTGILTSKFKLSGQSVTVETLVGDGHTLAVRAESRLLRKGLTVRVSFPYPDPGKLGGTFARPDEHFTTLTSHSVLKGQTDLVLRRKADNEEWFVRMGGQFTAGIPGDHSVILSVNDDRTRSLWFIISLARKEEDLKDVSYKQVRDSSLRRFYTFWNKGAMLDVSGSPDIRAEELERRIILSMYLSFVQCTAGLPPQETGLTCNSWYGKFHLEMHPIHSAWLALYGRGDLLERSLEYYFTILEKAKENAARNGFSGARWPKMTDPKGENSPSPIAPLLIWQQPHIIYMVDLLRRSRFSSERVEVPGADEEAFIRKYLPLIKETADFMADFLTEGKNGELELLPPFFSVQEKGRPEEIKNPPFEAAYWKFGLKAAYGMLSKISAGDKEWLDAAERIRIPEPVEGLLPAWEGYPETYDKLNIDHPSMLFAPGFLPEEFNEAVIAASLEKFKQTWNLDSLWGWDFAFLAMSLAKMGRYNEAFDMLLWDTEKNTYGVNGNNIQGTRADLPLYLPGNGSLLLAMSAMKATDRWYIETEGIMNYPY